MPLRHTLLSMPVRPWGAGMGGPAAARLEAPPAPLLPLLPSVLTLLLMPPPPPPDCATAEPCHSASLCA